MRELYSPRGADSLCSKTVVCFKWKVESGEIVREPDSLGIKKAFGEPSPGPGMRKLFMFQFHTSLHGINQSILNSGPSGVGHP